MCVMYHLCVVQAVPHVFVLVCVCVCAHAPRPTGPAVKEDVHAVQI